MPDFPSSRFYQLPFPTTRIPYGKYGIQRVLPLFSAQSKGSTRYKEYGFPGVRTLARSTVIIFSTVHGEYGVQGVRYSKGTNFSTRHGHYFKHGARRARSTESTVLKGYEFKHGVRLFLPARGTRGTEYEEYESSYEHPWTRGQKCFRY